MNDFSGAETRLEPELTEQIRDLCQQGYLLYDQQDYNSAIRRFFSAWTLLPKPQSQWREAGWILTALGDAYFAKGNYESGREALTSALHCPDTQHNPIIHLRLGQCLYELKDLSGAAHHFSVVLSQGGEELFGKENPKYLALLANSQV